MAAASGSWAAGTIFEIQAAKLTDFRDHGGRTIVDSTGKFHGRDVNLYEALSRSTGTSSRRRAWARKRCSAAISLTPQTNPPTPWPAEKFAELFTKEITATAQAIISGEMEPQRLLAAPLPVCRDVPTGTLSDGGALEQRTAGRRA